MIRLFLCSNRECLSSYVFIVGDTKHDKNSSIMEKEVGFIFALVEYKHWYYIPFFSNGCGNTTKNQSVKWQSFNFSFKKSLLVLQSQSFYKIDESLMPIETNALCLCLNVNTWQLCVQVATIVTGTQLVIEGTQPHAPYNLSGTATEFSVTLNWLPGYSGGPDYKQDYTIWYREAGVSEWIKIPVTPSGATSVNIFFIILFQ